MSRSSFARSMLATLSGLSHRWLGARPGGPGAHPLLALCLLLLLEAAVAAVPTWAVMAPVVGRNCPKVEVNMYPISEAPGIAAGVARDHMDHDSCMNTCHCDADLRGNLPVNNTNESTKNPTGDIPGYVVSIRGARQHHDWVGSRVFDATNNDWKQNPYEEAHGAPAVIRSVDIGHGNTFHIGSHGSLNLQIWTTTTGKKNPYKEASGGAAGIKKASASSTLPLFPTSNNVSCTPVSAIGANVAASTSTVSPAPNQRHGLRRHLCPPLPLTREAMTLSNRKWRLLETS